MHSTRHSLLSLSTAAGPPQCTDSKTNQLPNYIAKLHGLSTVSASSSSQTLEFSNLVPRKPQPRAAGRSAYRRAEPAGSSRKRVLRSPPDLAGARIAIQALEQCPQSTPARPTSHSRRETRARRTAIELAIYIGSAADSNIICWHPSSRYINPIRNTHYRTTSEYSVRADRAPGGGCSGCGWIGCADAMMRGVATVARIASTSSCLLRTSLSRSQADRGSCIAVVHPHR